MRNWIWMLLAALVFAGAPLPAEAGNYLTRATGKLVHGVADVAYSPFELLISPVTHVIDFDRHERISLYGGELGVFVGVVKCGARLGRGSADVVTFFLPSERHDRWDWEWSFRGFQTPLSEPTVIEDAR